MNRKKGKAACTSETTGIIQKVKSRGMDFPTELVIAYTVDSVQYEMTDTVKYRSEAIKLGFLPIGQRRTPRLGDTHVGTAVRIFYNPQDPNQSYLPDNQGKDNV